jgi:lysophospholipase L1-like esterase
MVGREVSQHVVLLGDSIFDNAVYVPGEPPVIEQLRSQLPVSAAATLLAIDGVVTQDVSYQLQRLPSDATDLVVSVGGNDALGASALFQAHHPDPLTLMRELAQAQAEFALDYRNMLAAVRAQGKRTTLCTIYDTIPDLPRWQLAALAYFNDVIIRTATQAGVPVIDLRLICTDRHDYSSLSPIEPSARGGAKIAAAIAHILTTHDYDRLITSIYT